MVWWVYHQVSKVNELDAVVVATDDERIASVCKNHGMACVMTDASHSSVFERVREVAQHIEADEYIVINGDEPLINSEHIRAVIDKEFENAAPYAINTITKMSNPAEVCDPTNIKVVFDSHMRALYMTRTPVPFPYKSIKFDHYKHVGITGINKAMLAIFDASAKYHHESIEGIDHLRIIESGHPMLFRIISHCDSLSVDTPKDLEKVRAVMNELLKEKKS